MIRALIGLLALITKPIGVYLTRVLDANGKTFLDPVIRPLERLTYSLMGVDRNREHTWREYGMAMLMFSLATCALTYAVLRLQHLLPLNPQHLPGLSGHLAFNTAVSFTTNTNWQSYGGESTLSYFSQMVGLTLHNFAGRRQTIERSPELAVVRARRGMQRRIARLIVGKTGVMRGVGQFRAAASEQACRREIDIGRYRRHGLPE